MSGVAVVQDLRIGSAVKLNERNDIPARRAQWLDGRIDRFDGRWIAGRKVGVERSGIGGEGSNLDAQYWIAGHYVREATAIAVSYRKDSSGIDAIRLGEIGNQVLDKADIINIGVRSTRCPCWVRFVPFSVSVHVYGNAVRI
jgi:hypothetical protein